MMDFLQVLVLSIVQGITEFLPVSSSAHLILVPVLFQWQDQGLVLDVAVHVGTLLAVVVYYRRDLSCIIRQFFQTGFGKQMSADAKIGWAVLWATIPLGLVGILSKDFIEQHLRTPLVLALATIVFGLLLGVAYHQNRPQRSLESINWLDALIIGIAQALALIPGTSRSGITMTAAFLRHFKPQEAARFSFLLSIPAILMPFALFVVEIWQHPQQDWDWLALGLGIGLSFVFALACIHFFLRLLDKLGMLPFVVYRLILGAALLWVFYF